MFYKTNLFLYRCYFLHIEHGDNHGATKYAHEREHSTAISTAVDYRVKLAQQLLSPRDSPPKSEQPTRTSAITGK